MPPVLASTTSHKREAIIPTLDAFAKLGLRDLDLNLHHFLELGQDPAVVARVAAAAGQRVPVVSGGWCDFFHRAPAIDDTYRSVDRQVEIARALGAATLRLFFGRLHAEAWSPEAGNIAAGNIARLADRHPDILFVFENHDGATLVPAVCRDILARVNCPAIRMNFDPINFARVGANAMDAFTTVEPWIGHMHLKGLEAGEFCEFGKGDVDLTPILARLLASGYAGRFTVEYEGHNDGTLRLLQSVKLAQETLDRLSRP
jgi:sugar phosphate isomerase/epimerase